MRRRHSRGHATSFCGPGVCALLLAALAVHPPSAWADEGSGGEDPYVKTRERMVSRQIEAGPRGREAVNDPKVLEAMRTVKRHRFVPDSQEENAYRDSPLPIGHGQTISQPYIVAYMTEALQVDSDDTVLEVGTGSGYQAAVLAEIVKQVYTIEIVEPLAKEGAEHLREAGYTNVETRAGDGYHGWKEHAPFDAIVVTAAAAHIPPPLIEQLKPGGRMIIPVGPPLQTQSLMLVEKQEDGSVTQRNVMLVRFVPLTRGG